MISDIIDFAKDHFINVIIIVIAAGFAHNFSMIVVRRLVKRAVKLENLKTKRDEKQRKDTLLSIVNAAVRAIVWIMAGLLLLAELDINIGPLLAGAGIAGIALGFGAQSMVKNFLAGFFILAENHYRVGDVIKINQTVSGVVERVTLRETVLRDLDGMVHHVPNGEISIATNMTMEYANVNLDIRVDYETDLEKLEEVINDVGGKLSEDPKWSDSIIEAPAFLRVNDLGEASIEVKITGRTAPMQQWSITGELRKRLKIAFDKNGIRFALPQRVIHQAKK